jgi:hypothetical protein
MQTRSMTQRIMESSRNSRKELSVEIDFDEAIAAWNLNKKKLSDCTYKYICIHCSITGKKCGKNPLENSNYCKTHIKK